jgi:tRNA A-37 threonylcarbamoyl transferase component Bud32
MNADRRVRAPPRAPSFYSKPGVRSSSTAALTAGKYSRMSTRVGTRLDKYELQHEVGHGGMAVVFRGLDTVLDREVAIKVLHPHLADREESRLRLRREALTVAKLRHENILEIYDYSGPDATESYIVTEFIHGMTLRQWLDTRWRPHPVLAALIIHRLCVALTHAHRSDVVHRDLKPENVMIREDGCLKLMDFGIAQIIDHQKLTMTGQLLGSPAYMAPELINGRPLDARTDLFSVGIMLYQLATGMLPFSGRNPHEVLSRIADADYPPAASVCSLVDDELEAIIAKALAREPDQRYQTSEALAADLETYLEAAGIPATGAEVMAYFGDHERFAREINGRVCAALMNKAEAAIQERHSARAIRLLGRVLELVPDDRRARALLSRLRDRERRIHQLVIAGAVLAGIGVVAAGALLLLSIPPDPEPLPAEPTPTIPGGKPLIGGPVVPPLDPRANPPNAPQNPTEGPTEDSSSSSGGGGKKLPTTRPIRPPLATKDPKSRETTCTLALSGIPATTARSHVLKYGARVEKLTALEHQLVIDSDETSVNLTGPRYFGNRIIRRSECHPGVRLELVARPRNAVLTFRGVPPQTTATCISGPPCPTAEPKIISDRSAFPEIPMTSDQAFIEMSFKSAGYEPRTDRLSIQPGNNTLTIDLKPRGE